MIRDWTGCSDFSWQELELTLGEALAGELEDGMDEALKDVVLQRLTVSLRTRSRNELISEAAGISRLLRTAKTHGHDEIACTLEVVGRGMAIAASRNDPSAVDSVLLSYRSHGKRLLELIAEQGEDGMVRRQELVMALGIEKKNDSMMSHMLRDFERAGLIFRTPAKGSTPVMVGLDYEGKKLVRERLQPEWIELIIDVLRSLAVGYRKQSIIERFMAAGFPSHQGAERVADALLAVRGIPIRLVRMIDELKGSQDQNILEESGKSKGEDNYGTTQRSTGSYLYPSNPSETEHRRPTREPEYV